MKRIIIVHQWSGSPESDWYPWLKKKLENNGYKVLVPVMPDPDHPKIEPWVKALREAVGRPDEQTLLIGHSIGGQTIVRYLSALSGHEKFAGVLLVTPWVTLLPAALPDDDYRSTGAPWLNVPINWESARRRAVKFKAVFSDDDPYVPMADSETFKEKLGAEITILHSKGHLTAEEEHTEVPEVWEMIEHWGSNESIE